MGEQPMARWHWVTPLLGTVYLVIGVVALVDALTGPDVRVARVLSGSVCVLLGAGTIWRWSRYRAAAAPEEPVAPGEDSDRDGPAR
ncbi:hypothetical protein [Lentzea sp. NBRC 102530]|uniref:hypothetical protein n=1 Tax=Lentzea sp. NBRC 102530 TaxID=3032201 RepID=UPI002556997C|nr:hypothetical protein [Lentzea sp. NBRC 102530]